MVKYVYDAWGNHKVYNPDGTVNSSSSFIGNKNPFRYRGYYYDVETKFYYLQSRYYDPEIGQFISPDTFDYLAPETIGGVNLYAYCFNNPVMGYDPTGHWEMPNWLKWVIGGVAFVAAVAVTVATGGAVVPVVVGMAASVAIDATVQGIASAVNGGDFWEGFKDGAADGAMWGGVFALAGSTVSAIKYSVNAKGAVAGTKHITAIKKGQKFDRFGVLQGKYMTDVGTPSNLLALPAGNSGVKTTLQATRNFRAYTGIIANAFGGTGGGVQYVMRYPIEKLIKMGWLIVV